MKDQYQGFLDTHRLVGTQQIGAATYGVYRCVRYEDGELGRRQYLYKVDTANGESDLPPHIIDCTEPVIAPYLLRGRCFLFVGYNEITANLLFLSPLPEIPKIPLEQFPEFALDVKRMLETADVTDNYNRVPPELPFLE